MRKIWTPEELESLVPADYGLTPAAVKAHMFGAHLVDPATGKEMPDIFYETAIEQALALVESELDIVIIPREVSEEVDYSDNEYFSHMYTQVTTRPIIQVNNFQLQYGNGNKRKFRMDSVAVTHLSGQIQISPQPLQQFIWSHTSQYETLHTGFGASGLGSGMTTIPQALNVNYYAGLMPRQRVGVSHPWEIPANLEKLILKHAIVDIMVHWGRLVSTPGVAGQSLSIDGISQTKSTTASAKYGVMSADIEQAQEEIKVLKKSLDKYFGDYMVTV